MCRLWLRRVDSGLDPQYFFFFQAEDGIRDLTVTGVQTCALPILDSLVNAHGPITQLVNNAGIWLGDPILEQTNEHWAKTFTVNVTAPFVLIRELAKVMIRAGGGRIVNVASRNAFVSSVNNSAYDASKA